MSWLSKKGSKVRREETVWGKRIGAQKREVSMESTSRCPKKVRGDVQVGG